MQRKSFSWSIIAIFMFLFFPVGLILMVKKIAAEKFNYVNNGKALRILGCILIAFAAMYLTMALTGNLETTDGSSIVGGVIVGEIIFVGGGVLCVFIGCKYIRRGIKYNRYVSIINASDNLLVDNIAAAMHTTYDKAIEDIQAMLDEGFFMNSYLDLNKRKLIIEKVAAKPSVNVNNANADLQRPANNRAHPVKCPNCGATNTIVSGAKNECEYCGSPL